MHVSKKNEIDEQTKKLEEEEAIDRALVQMTLIYKSRCVQPPSGSNVTIREIKKTE
jgi:hypothetical protein